MFITSTIPEPKETIVTSGRGAQRSRVHVSMRSARTTMATWLLIVSSAIALGVGSVVVVQGGGSSARPVLTGAYQSYESVEALFNGADVVAIVTVGGIAGYEVDGDEESVETGVPMVFLDVSVDHYFKAPESLALTNDLTVGLIDERELEVPELTGFTFGSKLLVFVEYLPAHETPGIRSFADFVVPLSADNGVFDVKENRATARSPLVVAFNETEVAAARGESDSGLDEVQNERVAEFRLSRLQSLADSLRPER